MTRWLFLALVMAAAAVPAHGQSRPYAGASVAAVTGTRSDSFQPGGTAWGGSLLVGVPLSSRLSVEFEPSFIGPLDDGEYTYSATHTLDAHVITHRRDTFFTFQLRLRTGSLEPVLGISYVRARASRHATIVDSGRPYFDDDETQHAMGLAGGIDARVKLTSHVSFVPTFRVFVVARSSSSPISAQTSGGPFAFRYGSGARVTF